MSGPENTNEEEAPNLRSVASMTAFDAMPKAWRRFCADYPRTAPGQQLAEVLAESDRNVSRAKKLLRVLLPISQQKRGVRSRRLPTPG